MRFCRGCGGTLAFFANGDDNCCTACHGERQQTTPSSMGSGGNQDILSTVLRIVDDKLVVLSREGWLLWSGSPHEDHSLKDILEQAGRILDIRSRRKR